MPEVPDRTWFDPVLNAWMHTGNDALKLATTRIPWPPVIAIDIETPGLDRQFEINCVTIAWWEGDQVYTALLDPCRNPWDHDQLKFIITWSKTLVLHNAPFDIPALVHHGLMTVDDCNKVVDTLTLARMAFPDKIIGKSLESLAVAHLGLVDMAGGMLPAFHAAGYRNKEDGYRGMDIDSPVYRHGAMADTVATLRLEPVLRQHCRDLLTDHPFPVYGCTTTSEADDVIAVQETVHRVMLRRTARGLNVDSEYLDAYCGQVADERDRAIKVLAEHGLEGGAGKSPKLVEYLNTAGVLPVDWPRTSTGRLRATAEDLERLERLDHPVAHAQRRMAFTDKVIGYLEKVNNQARVTGRCHPQVGTLGASATGRMSYSLPELQQFPAEARPVLCDDGQGLTSVDWSQIEPVLMGLLADDRKFLQPYEDGLDLYEPIQRAAGISRDVAKKVMLAMRYGQGLASTARDIGHTTESAAQIRRQILSAMPGCASWMIKVQNIAAQHGAVVTIGGRILPVSPQRDYTAVNYCCQGGAADLLSHTIVEMERRGIADEVVLAMHDELVVSTPVAAEVREIMQTPPEFLVRWAGRTPVLRTDSEDLGHSWKKC